VSYVVDLNAAGRQVAFYFDMGGQRAQGPLGAIFRILADGRTLEVGTPTLFASAPTGETLDRFLRELQETRAHYVAYPLQIIDHGPSLIVLGARMLHEEQALGELQERFADHDFDYNTTHISTSGRTVRTPLATF